MSHTVTDCNEKVKRNNLFLFSFKWVFHIFSLPFSFHKFVSLEINSTKTPISGSYKNVTKTKESMFTLIWCPLFIIQHYNFFFRNVMLETEWRMVNGNCTELYP